MNEMTNGGLEQLVQRFVDQELSAEERVRFLARLGRDEALRRRTLDLEQLILDTSRLQRPAVPEGFAARIMAQTAQRPPSFFRGLADAVWAPRDLHWNLAGAGALAVFTLLVFAGAMTGRFPLRPGQPAAGTSVENTPADAGATASTVLVRLVVLQPSARTVQVAGDFNGWNPASTALEQISDGAWAVTIPLKPGRYEYMFVVDGKQWVADPFAAEQSDDGFGSRNAVLDVRPVGAKS